MAPAVTHIDAPKTAHRHIWVVTGPAGCGKSTVAKDLSQEFSLPYLEGDEYHPPANIAKMSQGIPLDDADRWDWLILLREKAVETLHSTGVAGVVLTCSALKRKYRDVLRIAPYNDHTIFVHFVYLQASQDVLLQRVHARVGHYMKDSMVQSQFQSLEEPYKEEKDTFAVDASGDQTLVRSLVLQVVERILSSDTVGNGSN